MVEFLDLRLIWEAQNYLTSKNIQAARDIEPVIPERASFQVRGGGESDMIRLQI